MEDLEASLKPKIEEALEVVATIDLDNPWFTETLMQKKLDRPKEELVYSVIHEGKKVVAVVLHKLSIRDNVYLKKPIKAAGLSAQDMRKHNLLFRMVHGISKSLATEKRLLKEIEGSQRQEEEDIFALRCTQCPQCDAELAYATEHLRRTISGKYTRNCRYHKWSWYMAPDAQNWWELDLQTPYLLRKGDTKDSGEEIREVQRYGVVLLQKVDETPIDANDHIGANTSPTLVMGKSRKTWTSLVSKNALDEEIQIRNLVCVEKEMASLTRMKLPPALWRKRYEVRRVHQCVLDLITKQALATNVLHVCMLPNKHY